MKQNIKKIKKLLCFFVFFIFAFNVFAQECPERTTVNGQDSITFVGGVVDMGGDTSATVWFEYGTSPGNYTFKTEKITLNKPEKYCITVSNLQPCTTYYYRAAMENKAGPSYGAELSKSTACPEQSTSSEKVLGIATASPTGTIKKIFLELLIIPFIFAGLLVILFKPHIFAFEEWLELKKNSFRKISSEKILEMKINKIKINEKKF